MEFLFMSMPFRPPLLSLLQLLLEALFLSDIGGEASNTCNSPCFIPDDITAIPNVADLAIGANDSIFGIIKALTGFAVEKAESALMIVGMNGIEPGVGIGVHRAARTPPNRFVGRAYV